MKTLAERRAVISWRTAMIGKAGRSVIMNGKNMSSLFYAEVGKIGTQDIQNVSFGSNWLVFYGHALVAISRYNMKSSEVEAFTVRDIGGTPSPIAYQDYKQWINDVDDKLLRLKEEYTTPPQDWLSISVEDIHAKAAQWFADEVSNIVQDKLTGDA
jgi:hypothetical protein